MGVFRSEDPKAEGKAVFVGGWIGWRMEGWLCSNVKEETERELPAVDPGGEPQEKPSWTLYDLSTPHGRTVCGIDAPGQAERKGKGSH